MNEKEKSLHETYDLFFNICTNQDPRVELLEDIVVNKIMGFGTTYDEKIETLDALKNLIIIQTHQSEGLDMKWDFKPVFRHKTILDDVAIFVYEGNIHVKVNDEINKLFLRFTTVLEYIDRKWQVIHWHGSKPENVESEEDTFGIQKWKRKNAELEKLVEQRTVELQKSLEELKSTQAQLIQSEKMASLGELTAGIAHEIQNPLNFVNNFSEVSIELLIEMNTELQNGNTDNANEILADLIQNLEKINHHGKRADAIVKGMLQHSRTSPGKREPIDINALCDEYIRLAYHGLRAKDHTFNAIIKTDFDSSLKMININHQDVGRVILNLLTNAFYAVNERGKNVDEEYKPSVSISTKQIVNGQVQIAIKDNGYGIPETIKEKIFQPFFTTKPTGQGTGLGLSLSYDIIKAHGGVLKVETNFNERKGSEFIIILAT